jgi:hypothetical protein
MHEPCRPPWEDATQRTVGLLTRIPRVTGQASPLHAETCHRSGLVAGHSHRKSSSPALWPAVPVPFGDCESHMDGATIISSLYYPRIFSDREDMNGDSLGRFSCFVVRGS